MKNTTPLHVPFAELPPEARVLFFLCTLTVFGPERPPADEAQAALARMWNSEQLTLDDLGNPSRIEEVFDKYAAIYRKDAWWLESLGISRQEAERAGFFREQRRSTHREVTRTPNAS